MEIGELNQWKDLYDPLCILYKKGSEVMREH